MLAPGDYILMYTDGVTEATGPGDKEYGLSRLKSLLKKHQGVTALDMVRILFADLTEFTGTRPQTDDRTIVVVRRL